MNQQQFHQLIVVLVDHRSKQRCVLVNVRQIAVGLVSQQQHRALGMIVRHSQRQGRAHLGIVMVHHVGVVRFLQQEGQAIGVARRGGAMYRCAFCNVVLGNKTRVDNVPIKVSINEREMNLDYSSLLAPTPKLRTATAA